MARYIDGFVIPIKKKKVKDYKKMATLGCKTWMKHGALDYYECTADNLKIPWGTPFNKLCKLKADETVIFAFIVYKSKAHCASVNKKVHKEFELKFDADFQMPFDPNRTSVGKFKTLIYASKRK